MSIKQEIVNISKEQKEFNNHYNSEPFQLDELVDPILSDGSFSN